MIINNVMNQLAAQLDTIAGLRVYDFPADHITPPAAVFAYPYGGDFDLTAGRGSDTITLPVWVIEGRMNDRASRDNLAPYADGAGAKSVKAVIEAGTYTAFDVVRVAGWETDPYRAAGIDYAATRFDLEIAGDGS